MTEPLLAPFALLRVAALPCMGLSELRPPNVARLCDEVVQAKREMERLRPIIEDQLHSAVPQVEDKKLRGQLIKLRRAVHNGQRFALADLALETLLGLLEPGAAQTVGAWLGARAAVDDCLAIADAVLTQDMQHHVRPRMRQLGANPDFARALALATPDLFRQLSRDIALQPTGSVSAKGERSLLSYLIRASVKANPFSTFMHVAVVEVDREGDASAPELEGVPRVSSCVISRSVIARLHRAMVVSSASKGQTRLAVNKSLRALDQGLVDAFTSEYIVVLGRSWRLPRRATFRLHPQVVRLLFDLGSGFVFSDIVATLAAAGLDDAQAARLAQKLLASGCVEAEAATDGLDSDAQTSLMHSFEASAETEGQEGFRAVGDLIRLFERVAIAEARERAPIVEDLRAHEVAALTAFGSNEAVAFRNVVFESGAFQSTCGRIGGPFAKLIAEVGPAIRSRVIIDPVYLTLRDRFVELYGAGGRCTDIARFLMECSEEMSAKGGWVKVPESGWERPEPESAQKIGVTVSVQVAAASRTAAANGDGLVVLNRAWGGIGWVTAHHANGSQASHEALAGWIRSWLTTACAPDEPIDMLLCGECSDLQSHPRLTDRVLAIPGEPIRPGTPGVVRLEDLVLEHDVSTGRLVLSDEGRRVAVVYLGGTVLLPSGLPNLLWKISNPCGVLPPDDGPPTDPDAEIVRLPRETVGRVVLRRATWWVRSRWLQAHWFSHSGAARLLHGAELLASRDMPSTFFAKPYIPMLDPRMLRNVFKPLWIDSRLPYCVEHLEQMASESEWVMMTEVLPALEQNWTTIDGETHVGEMHVEMLMEC